MKKVSILLLLVCICSFLLSCGTTQKLESWTVEKTRANSVINLQNDTIEIFADGGVTLWYNEILENEYVISYEGCIVIDGCKYDRLSDLNCFWAATDPKYPNDLFLKSDWREGKLHNYYLLDLYYVGYGGNENTTTRFRKYLGKNENPPLIYEYTNAENLLKPNVWYEIEIRVTKSEVQFLVNNKVLFVQSNDLLSSGHFGFRAYSNHMKITNFKIQEN